MTRPDHARRVPTAGVTLVEMLVALALMALIGVAGFAVLDQILRSQRLTAGRLDQLAELQRGMYLLQLDFSTALPASLRHGPESSAVRLQRAGDRVLALTYRLEGGTLWREIADPTGRLIARQPVLTNIATVEWRFLEGAEWAGTWPPPDAVVRIGQVQNPRAVELVLTLAATAGQLRRVAALPGSGS